MVQNTNLSNFKLPEVKKQIKTIDNKVNKPTVNYDKTQSEKDEFKRVKHHHTRKKSTFVQKAGLFAVGCALVLCFNKSRIFFAKLFQRSGNNAEKVLPELSESRIKELLKIQKNEPITNVASKVEAMIPTNLKVAEKKGLIKLLEKEYKDGKLSKEEFERLNIKLTPSSDEEFLECFADRKTDVNKPLVNIEKHKSNFFIDNASEILEGLLDVLPVLAEHIN
ncbi:MAG: hypothetical protein WCK67_11920 [bacterium]